MAPWISADADGPRRGITRFINCRLVTGDKIVKQDLYVSSVTGKILSSQELFFQQCYVADETVDLQDRLVAPGLIDVQLNGAFGFDFSVVPENVSDYGKTLRKVNKDLVKTGVTSYLPTLTSQKPEVYQSALPFLRPSGGPRDAEDGSESLGAHCEGPFLNPVKNGIHNTEVLISAEHGLRDIEACYGAENMQASKQHSRPGPDQQRAVTMITAAPEQGKMTQTIPDLVNRGIVYSIGHSDADYEQASSAVAKGATMITHLFNAMRPLHHRNPGIFGVLGQSERQWRPYFGIIADGIHLHPTAIKIAFDSHPDGFILVTDAMRLVGLPDGIYDWTNGDRIVKKGPHLTLEGTDKIAGSSITLIECVSNFLNWSGVGVAEALKTVTLTPARMLGLHGTKGSLDSGADADLVVLSEATDAATGHRDLHVDQVWKFGTCVHATK
ncbi:hypothetical protein FH972_022099 [Carpinus fangiana]|uniref:N-acetylglucosamine-6-phosphate deacetylase n=1 Tax=Carpinus fangiana TaxID=176857 RepID=A0A5N6KRW5_9ROSI|nr:hypothetical protein FH972_022099 [Carpinus fangiana]